MDLARIFEPIQADLELVEQELKAMTNSLGDAASVKPGPRGILPRIVQHPFTMPGKRIRPALVLLAAQSVDGMAAREPLIKLAAAVELLHAASLVHDDVIDGSDARRHQVSLNKRFGNRVAVLAGDILYTHFFSMITSLPSVSSENRFALLELFIETTKAMCIGEIFAQEARAEAKPLALNEYVEISSAKTASLFSACCEAAGLMSGAEESFVRILREFGLAFGLTFQMADDLADRDHGLDPSVDLRAMALEYARRAGAAVGELPEGEFCRKLHDLIDYLIGRINS